MFNQSKEFIIATPSAILRRKRQRKGLNIFAGACLTLAVVLIANQWRPGEQAVLIQSQTYQPDQIDVRTGFIRRLFTRESAEISKELKLNKAFLRDALSDYIEAGEFPSHLGYNNQDLFIHYTIDQNLQQWADARLARYNPDYGVFVAIEPDTGKVLALSTSRRDQQQSAALAFRATYPAASTFKMITAAAALEEGIANPETVYAFNGKSTSLYKRQVFDIKENKWTRRMSLKTAFAKSVNPIFGRLGADQLGGETLLAYAERFGFNAKFVADFDFDNGHFTIDPSDQWQAAEAGSGYTRRSTLSPIHGAVLAAAIANGGKLIAPSLVESVTNSDKEVLYSFDKPRTISVLSDKTANAMQKLMRATMTEGTGRKTFRTFVSKKYSDVIIGGKSGHLSGTSPKGSYDWFIGYGARGTKKIAYAMLCINKEKWYVKSVRFAREALEHYFKVEPSKMATQALSDRPNETS